MRYRWLALCAALIVVTLLVVRWLTLGAGSPAVSELIAAGAKVDESVAAGAWWRLVSAGWLHAGPLHLTINALTLGLAVGAWVRLGRGVRDETPARVAAVLALALFASVAGFLASFLVRAGASVGASAAAQGVLAATVVGVWLHRHGLPRAFHKSAPSALTVAFLMVMAASFTTSGADHAAHVGGAVAGAALAPIAEHPGARRVLIALALALVVVAWAAWVSQASA